jgi:hypothetical protein
VTAESPAESLMLRGIAEEDGLGEEDDHLEPERTA